MDDIYLKRRRRRNSSEQLFGSRLKKRLIPQKSKENLGVGSSSVGGLLYRSQFVNPKDQSLLLSWIESLHPLWEYRYSASNPPPEGKEQRRLLRPVYWLGNWQFACLNYFHPPRNIYNCCVEAEPFPPLLQNLANQIELEVHRHFQPRDIPKGWHFNTCLINFYGQFVVPGQKVVDAARVGEHKDFEPGPVGSISFGERALFQFVRSQEKTSKSEVVVQQWLENGSLQVFGGDKFKKKLFHRVQRVENKTGKVLGPTVSNFETRRINLTFRYVPAEFIVPFGQLPVLLRKDIQPYVEELAEHAAFFRHSLGNIL